MGSPGTGHGRRVGVLPVSVFLVLVFFYSFFFFFVLPRKVLYRGEERVCYRGR